MLSVIVTLCLQLEVSLDALLLLSKLEYAVGDYEGALAHLTAAGLDQLTEKTLPTRSLRIVAESYAIKGEVLIFFFFYLQQNLGGVAGLCEDYRIAYSISFWGDI